MRHLTKFLTATALSLGFALATPAAAQTRDFARVGGWDAFLGHGSNGTRLCGVSMGGNAGQFFSIKHFAGEAYLTIHLIKTGWNIPRGTKIAVQMQIDRAEPFIAPTATGGGNMIEIAVMGEEAVKFLNLFRAGLRLSIDFLQGDEGGWTAPLNGSTAISGHFLNCINRWTAEGTLSPFTPPAPPAPTQPFSAQPYAPSPAPVQNQPFSASGPGRRT